MQKALFFLLFIIMFVSTAGCNAPTNTAETSATLQTFTSVETTPIETGPVMQLPMVSAAMPLITEKRTNNDGVEIFSSTCQNLTLVLPEQEISNKITLDFLNQTDFDAEINQLYTQAKQAYETDPQTFTPYWFQSTYAPTRLDRSVLSLYGSYAAYSGGAHGTYSYRALNYDMVTGEPLSLSHILTNEATSDALCELILTALAVQKEDNQLFDEFEAIVSGLIKKSFPHNVDWYFSNSGLCFFFSPYEIAPFSTGDVVAEIPYAKLTALLDDSYFPAERESAQGILQAEYFEESASDRFSQFTELSFQENGRKILLYTDKLLYDIQLKIGTQANETILTEEEHTVLSVHSLSPGDAIMIELPIDEAAPLLLFHCNTDNGNIYYKIEIKSSTNVIQLIQQ